MTSLAFEPLISPALWMALAVAAGGMLAAYAWRRHGGVTPARWWSIVTLMAVGCALPLILLLNPTWVRRIPRSGGKPMLTVLVDRSASMATADADHGQTRYQAAMALARRCAEELKDRFDVRVKTFAETVTSHEANDLASVAPDGTASDLAGAIGDGIEGPGSAGQAVLLLSDGIHNAAGGGPQNVLAAARNARAAGVPVYTQTFGKDSDVTDIAIRMPMTQQVAFQGQKVPVIAYVKRRGKIAPLAHVSLWQDGRKLEEKDVFLEKAQETESSFSVSEAKPGLYRYEVRVDSAPGEVTTVNNYASFLLRVTDRPIRVLLLEGAPYWDNKFLMRTLASDPSVELDGIVRITQNRFLRRTIQRSGLVPSAAMPSGRTSDGRGAPEPAAAIHASPESPPEADKADASTSHETVEMLTDPAQFTFDREKLRNYQVIVLGRGAETYLNENFLADLRLWISRDSGALVCSRGQPVSQVTQTLDRLLPVRWTNAAETRFRVDLTDQGRSLQWLPLEQDPSGQALHRLPSLATKATIDQVKPLASILAAGTASGERSLPVVSYQPFGAGRVVVVEGAGMWRWAFLAPKYQQHEQLYHALWQSLLRWLISGAGLMPGERAALRADKVSFTAGEQITAQLLLRDETDVPDVELRGDTLPEPRRVTPVALADEPSTYRVPFGQLPEGRYEAKVAGDESWGRSAVTVFDVRKFQDEQLDITARPDVMARIASATGGSAINTTNTEEIIGQFKRYLDVNRPERVLRRPAWDKGPVLAAILVIWSAAWALRRNSGLV
jgi:hypothetical protein